MTHIFRYYLVLVYMKHIFTYSEEKCMRNNSRLRFFAGILSISILLNTPTGRIYAEAVDAAIPGLPAKTVDAAVSGLVPDADDAAAPAAADAIGGVPSAETSADEGEAGNPEDLSVISDQAEQIPVSVFPGDVPGGCGVLDEEDHFTDSLTYTISDGTLTIYGKGEMGEMMHRQPWEDEAESIQRIVIGKDVTYIGFGAFRYLPNLTSVTIPATVKRIGSFAFQACENLKEVHIEAEVVGEAAFIHCRKLEKVYIGSGVKAIGVSAFEDCPRINGIHITDVAAWCGIYFGGYNSNPLEQNREGGRNHIYLNGQEIIDLDIPQGVTKIGDYAFHCAKNIRSVNIPSSVTAIGEYAFFQNEALRQVTGAASVTTIGTQAFEGDISLAAFPFHEGLRRIGAYAFRYAPLASVTMHNGEIGKYAFDGCGNLTSLHIGDGVRIGENAFRGCPASVPSNVSDEKQTGRMGRWGELQLEWTVLDVKDGKALVLCKNIIEFMKYHSYTSPSKSGYTWGDSTLRQWLNKNFYNRAFSNEEKEKIIPTAVYNDDNPIFGTEDGGDSFGRIFILSASELNRYLPDSADRMASRLPSAQSIDPNTGMNDSAEEHPYLNTSYYWVRTPGLYGYSQCYVHYTGNILYDGQSKSNWIVGVRPAMWVDEDALDTRGPEALVNDFVVRLYRYCFDREPDAKGLSDWVSVLKSGNESAAKVVRSFFFSEEMSKRGLGNDDFLTICYHVMMDRDADDQGMRRWRIILDNGFSRLYVLRQFINSLEFTRICDQYGLKKGTITVTEPRDQNYGVTSFVARCYVEALGRFPDADGINSWTAALLNAKDKKSEAAKIARKGFLHSEEFLNRQIDNMNFCRILYMIFLGREPDFEGMVAWTSRLNEGADRDKIIDGFAKSQEFSQLLDSYGL